MDSRNEVEPENDHVYSGIDYYRETTDFLVASFVFYKRHLEGELSAIKEDAEIAALIGPKFYEDSDLPREIARLDMHIGRFEEFHRKHQGRLVSVGAVSHGAIRYWKSIALLHINYLTLRRNVFSTRSDVSIVSLDAIDSKISELLRVFNGTGVFATATQMPLLVEQILPEDYDSPNLVGEPSSISNVPSLLPIVVGSIEIIDTDLRRRCLDLFQQFKDTNQTDRFDTVLSDATTVLEDRLRVAIGDTSGASVNTLIERAFGNNGSIKISAVVAEQAGVHALFRGTFGYIRNQSHHKLAGSLSADRVVQILGMIDYLLSLIEAGTSSGDS